MRLLVLESQNMLSKHLRVMRGEACLLPYVLKDNLLEHVFVDSVDSAGALTTAGVVAADKGAVAPWTAVLIGELLRVVAHFEAAFGTVDEAGKDTAYTVRRRVIDIV